MSILVNYLPEKKTLIILNIYNLCKQIRGTFKSKGLDCGFVGHGTLHLAITDVPKEHSESVFMINMCAVGVQPSYGKRVEASGQ
jgi:hypothetical protein